MIKSDYNVVAVMSGTSLDGIDIIYAIYSYNHMWSFKIRHSKTISYSEKWKGILSGLVGQSIEKLELIDKEYTKYLGTAISNFIEANNISKIDFIASHGHTALHQPENKLTYQIGNRQTLADVLNKKVICDFRVQDVELGGQGAPLVPIGDRLLFHDYTYCLNLGGFANISFEFNNDRIAYDICPINIVLNHYASIHGLAYDDGGKLASQGVINTSLLAELNKLNFFKERPPKSLGLEWVNRHVFPLIDSYKLQTKDILRTFVEHAAIQIANNTVKDNSSVLLTGGGAYNKFLVLRIKALSKPKIITPENEIVEFKEALIFGLLGVLRERGEINCLKSVTGATRNHSTGKILFPLA